MKTKQQWQAERDFVADALRSIHTEFEARSLDEATQARFDEGIAFVTEADEAIEAIEAREAQVAKFAERAANVAPGDDRSIQAPIVRDDPYDLSSVSFGDDEAVRSKALAVIETVDGLRDDQREQTERLVRSLAPSVAATVVLTSRPAYRTGFYKVLGGTPELLTSDERDALNAYKRSVTLGSGTADYAVPTVLDPTIIDTGAHSTNPFRQLSTIKKITTSSWNGVASAGVTASWDGEEAEVSDDAPTLAQRTIPVFKGQVFVPFSVESQDWAELEQESRRMIAIAKDDLEGAAFVSGNGSTAPQGITTALDGTSSEIAPTTAETYAKADVEKLEGSLQARYRRNAAFVAHKVWINATRAFETTIPVGSLIGRSPIQGGNSINTLIDYPLYESSDMDSALPNAAATADNFGLLFGDFAQGYYIVDRVGLTVELVPHLFHTDTNRPNGTRGFLAWFRTGAKVVNANALAMLSIPTTA